MVIIQIIDNGGKGMCGYARRHVSTKQLHDLADLLDYGGIVERVPVDTLNHFYPAFGGAAGRQLKDLVIREGAETTAVDATWWFDCVPEADGLIVNNKRTTFNARNLNSPYWKGAIRHHRGIFVATGIGEGKVIDKKNRHFLVESEKPLLLGCVYRRFDNGCYSAAIITRDEHDRFSAYHDKAFPLMLPPDPDFLKLWLSDAREDEPAIADLLARPRIFNDLKVTPVKTFKDAKAVGEVELLAAD